MQLVDDVGFFLKRLRIFPRLFLMGYAILMHYMVFWAMVQDNITAAQAILSSAILTMATPLTKFYVDTGNNLYAHYDDFTYTSEFMRLIDKIGYIFESWRLFPLAFVTHFVVTLGIAVFWAFGLDAQLTNEQATFVSVFAANASIILGFYITTDTKNAKLEKQYKKRVDTDEKEA